MLAVGVELNDVLIDALFQGEQVAGLHSHANPAVHRQLHDMDWYAHGGGGLLGDHLRPVVRTVVNDEDLKAIRQTAQRRQGAGQRLLRYRRVLPQDSACVWLMNGAASSFSNDHFIGRRSTAGVS